MANENNKDIAKSLEKYTNVGNKGINLGLDGIENINDWYSKELKDIANSEIKNTRLETVVDNSVDEIENVNNKLQTKIEQYSQLRTTENNVNDIIKLNKIQTNKEDDDIKVDIFSKKLNRTKRISTGIKGAKLLNNSTQKIIRTGKDISSGLNENGTSSFKASSTRIMTKPFKKIANKATNKALKYTKKGVKKLGKQLNKKVGKKVVDASKM